MDTKHTGAVTYEQFASAFGVEDSAELRRLFALIDADSSGRLNFREYLLGLALLDEQVRRRSDVTSHLLCRLHSAMPSCRGAHTPQRASCFAAG